MSLPQSSDSMAFVSAFCGAWASRDVAHIISFLAPDVQWENVPIGIIHGRAAAAERIGAAFVHAASITWSILDIGLSKDGRVLTERIDVLSFRRGVVNLRIMGIFEVGDTGITLWRDYFDLADYERQLSLRGGA